MLRLFLAVAVVVCLVHDAPAADPPHKSENVLIVTLDGFRWQDFFAGADESLLDAKLGGVKDLDAVKTFAF